MGQELVPLCSLPPARTLNPGKGPLPCLNLIAQVSTPRGLGMTLQRPEVRDQLPSGPGVCSALGPDHSATASPTPGLQLSGHRVGVASSAKGRTQALLSQAQALAVPAQASWAPGTGREAGFPGG